MSRSSKIVLPRTTTTSTAEQQQQQHEQQEQGGEEQDEDTSTIATSSPSLFQSSPSRQQTRIGNSSVQSLTVPQANSETRNSCNDSSSSTYSVDSSNNDPTDHNNKEDKANNVGVIATRPTAARKEEEENEVGGDSLCHRMLMASGGTRLIPRGTGGDRRRNLFKFPDVHDRISMSEETRETSTPMRTISNRIDDTSPRNSKEKNDVLDDGMKGETAAAVATHQQQVVVAPADEHGLSITPTPALPTLTVVRATPDLNNAVQEKKTAKTLSTISSIGTSTPAEVATTTRVVAIVATPVKQQQQQPQPTKQAEVQTEARSIDVDTSSPHIHSTGTHQAADAIPSSSQTSSAVPATLTVPAILKKVPSFPLLSTSSLPPTAPTAPTATVEAAHSTPQQMRRLPTAASRHLGNKKKTELTATPSTLVQPKKRNHSEAFTTDTITAAGVDTTSISEQLESKNTSTSPPLKRALALGTSTSQLPLSPPKSSASTPLILPKTFNPATHVDIATLNSSNNNAAAIADNINSSSSIMSIPSSTTSPNSPSKQRPRKRNSSKKGQNAGRWTPEEHQAFLEGLKVCGREWKRVASRIPSRTSAQIRSHAQKYFAKLQRDHEEAAAVTAHGMFVNPSGHGRHLAAAAASPILPNTASSSSAVATTTIPATATSSAASLAPSLQHNIRRILADPSGVQQEVETTMGALRRRYRQLQQRLEQRQQQQTQQQPQPQPQNYPSGSFDRQKELVERDGRRDVVPAVSRTQDASVNDQDNEDEEEFRSVQSDRSISLASSSRELDPHELIALHVLGGDLSRATPTDETPTISRVAVQRSASHHSHLSSLASMDEPNDAVAVPTLSSNGELMDTSTSHNHATPMDIEGTTSAGIEEKSNDDLPMRDGSERSPSKHS